VEKAYDYAADNPTLPPSYLDMAAFDVDFADAQGLWTILTLVKQLEEAVEDTIMAAGSEAFHTPMPFITMFRRRPGTTFRGQRRFSRI
jgi:hypothetical protein